VTAKSLGLTKEEHDRIKAAPIKKMLKSIVAHLAYQVDSDWHDGYEDQAETKVEWFQAIQEPLQAVLDIGVGMGTALVQCNEVLKIVSDSLDDLLACPCRGDTMEDFGGMDIEFQLDLPWGDDGGACYTAQISCPYDAWSYVWVALLRTHTGLEGADEAALLRCIKDASDNMKGAELMELPGFLYDEFDEGDLKDGKGVPEGDSFARLVENKAVEWKELPTTKKVHRRRRAIDRRFSGSPSRRTRDYDSNNEGGDCVIS
jgi:hypothetical protein